MKNLYLFVLLLAFPIVLLAQSIHGIWTGTLVNDSMHRTQNFELGLSEYRGKITGYTYTTFIDNDTFYYSIKRIKAERRDGKLVIEDVDMVWNNFPQRASKHVKQTTTFPLINDSTIDITNGSWSTNQTRKYYSIGGSAKVKEQEEEKESDLLSHLQEMKVKINITVKQKEKNKDEAIAKNSSTIKPPQKNNNKIPENKNTDVVKDTRVKPLETKPSSETGSQKTDETKSSIAINKKENIVSNNNSADNENKIIQNTSVKQGPVSNHNAPQNVSVDLNKNNKTGDQTIVQTQVPEQKQTVRPTVTNEAANSNSSINKPVTQTQAPVQKQTTGPIVQKTNEAINNNKPEEKKIINTVSINAPVSQKKESIEILRELPAIVASRKNETMQDIYFKNDSLVLSLYDNGIVDGDTVSVFLNGENIISKQKLKEAATKRTIYISEKSDSVQLVLFAENLGTIPPNTGLLTVRDGDDIYQVRFSADLRKNASIILRRRKE